MKIRDTAVVTLCRLSLVLLLVCAMQSSGVLGAEKEKSVGAKTGLQGGTTKKERKQPEANEEADPKAKTPVKDAASSRETADSKPRPPSGLRRHFPSK